MSVLALSHTESETMLKESEALAWRLRKTIGNRCSAELRL